MLNIRQKPAHPSNFSIGRTARAITHIVIHVEAGTEDGTASWFLNPNSHVSAHYSVSYAGSIYQHVAEINTAWHAGLQYPYTWHDTSKQPKGLALNPNSFSIGIEHEGFANQPWPEFQVEASVELIADICRRYSIPCDRMHIVGHHEIYAGHDCPSSGCPIDRIVALAAAKVKGESK